MCGKLPGRIPWLTLLILWVGAGTAQPAHTGDFLDYTLHDDFGNVLLPGRLYVPPDPISPRPLILFMHGLGQSGTNNMSQVHGIDNLIAEAKRQDAFLYAPQTNVGWDVNDITDWTMETIDQAINDFPIHPSRIYVTGLSLGGGGTWNMLDRFPQRFAAGVTVAGVTPSNTFAAGNLIDQSVWAFHARDDDVVTKDASRGVVNAILSAAGEPTLTFPADDNPDTFQFVDDMPDLRYTEWPTGGHGIWTRVYDTPEMYDWLFAHELTEITLSNRSSYTAIDSDALFDDQGDRVTDGSNFPGRLIGELDGSTANEVARVITKYDLPNITDTGLALESATLRFYLLAKTGPPTGSLSLLHSRDDNDLDQLASDYEDPGYTDTQLDLFQPSDPVGSYYELDVTDFVLADYAADGDEPLSAFRLQMDDATFFEDGQGHGYVVALPGSRATATRPELSLTFVPEPSSLALAICGLIACGWRLRCRW